MKLGEIRARPSGCEWNPTTSEPAKQGDPPHAEAVVSVGADGRWHLCESCAALPKFKRLRVRKPLGRPPAPPPAPVSRPKAGLTPAERAEMAEHDAANARRRAEMLATVNGRPVAFDCETAGKSPCWACAIYGPQACLEDHIPPQVHDACVTEARRLYIERGKGPCHDCAFLRGSPEREQEGLLARVARQRDPFYCHQAMPLDGRGRAPAEGDYAPDDHSRYPVCAGWAAAREAYLARRAAARAMPSLRARVAKSTRAHVVAALGLQSFDAPRRRAKIGTLARLVPPGLGLWCITQRRQAVRLELQVVQQRLVARGFRVVGELHRRRLGEQIQHQITSKLGETPWISGDPEAALDAFAVVLVRAGVRAAIGSGPDKPPPYTRPPTTRGPAAA